MFLHSVGDGRGRRNAEPGGSGRLASRFPTRSVSVSFTVHYKKEKQKRRWLLAAASLRHNITRWDWLHVRVSNTTGSHVQVPTAPLLTPLKKRKRKEQANTAISRGRQRSMRVKKRNFRSTASPVPGQKKRFVRVILGRNWKKAQNDRPHRVKVKPSCPENGSAKPLTSQ